MGHLAAPRQLVSMSKKYNTEFLKDPLGFCKLHSLRPDPDGVGQHDLKVKTDYKPMASDHRVWYWNIKEEAEAQPQHAGLCLIDIVADKRKDYQPCFWLPWESGKIIKCTLKDKRLKSEDVRVFFTAPVDGCSVLIEGPRDIPSVYHANAGDYSVGDGTYAQRRNRTEEIERRWRKVPLAKRAIPKHVQTKTQYQAQFYGRALHGHHYMKDYLGSTDEPEQLRKNQTKIPKNKVLQNKYTGTVFGIKSTETDMWTFYFQRLLYIYYSDSIGRGRKQWFLSQAFQFWPGSGTVVLHKRSRVHRVDPEFGIEL